MGVAPAIVRADSLMRIIVPTTEEVIAINTMSGVDLNFTSAEFTLAIDDFSARFLGPAMIALCQSINKELIYASR